MSGGGMDADGTGAIARWFLEDVVYGRDVARLAELVTGDHLMGSGFVTDDVPRGPEGVRRYLETVWRAFPDLVGRIDTVLVGAGGVAVRTTCGGTQQDVVWGLEPNGRTTMAAVDYWFTFDGDRIRETRVVCDSLALALRLGAVVRAEPAPEVIPGTWSLGAPGSG